MARILGLEVIRTLRAVIPRPKIIAISGGGESGHTDILMTAAAFGAASTLRKPFEPHQCSPRFANYWESLAGHKVVCDPK